MCGIAGLIGVTGDTREYAQRLLKAVRHRGPVFEAAFSPGERWIASACRDGTARLWDPATGERRGPVLRHRGSVTGVAWSPDGARLLTSGGDGQAQLWKVSGLAGPDRECAHQGSVENIALSPDGRLVAALALEPDMAVWRMPEGERVATLPHGGAVASAAWMDGQTLLTVTGDGTLRQWDVPAGKLTRTVQVPGLAAEKLRSLRLSPDARFLAAAFKNQPAEIHETSGATLRTTISGEPAQRVQWSPCGHFLATTHKDGSANRITISAMLSGSLPITLRSADFLLALDTGARRLALVDAGYNVRILDRSRGTFTAAMPHDAALQAACFSADGRVFATGTQDGILRLWDAATAEPLSPPLPHASWIMSLAISADGHRIFTGVNGGVLSEWTVPARAWTPAEMRSLAAGTPGR